MTHLIFHLGDRKTGSAAINFTLAAGTWHCPKVKLQYPVGDGTLHIRLARALAAKDSGPRRQKYFDLIRQEIAAHQPDIAIISADQFEAVDPVVLRDALHACLPEYAATARFVSYVRPHIDRTLSAYAERLERGDTSTTLAEFHRLVLQSQRYLYAPRFLKWRQTFGDNFILRPLVRDLLVNHDPVQDFLTLVFGAEPFEIAAVTQPSLSPTLQDLAMIRSLHHRIAAPDGDLVAAALQDAVGRNLAARLLADPAPNPVPLQAHRDLARQMRDDYLADAQAVDAAFFDGTPLTDDLQSAPDRAPTSAQSLTFADQATPDEARMVATFTGLLSILLKSNTDHWARHFGARSPGPVAVQPASKTDENAQSEPKRKRRLGKGRRKNRRQV